MDAKPILNHSKRRLSRIVTSLRIYCLADDLPKKPERTPLAEFVRRKSER